MSDFTNSRDGLGAVFPDRAIDGEEWSRVEPLITPQQLRSRQLMGIPLISAIPNPITGERYVVEDEILADFINRAVAEVELESGLTIFPVTFEEKHPFDMNFWRNFGYLKVDHRPVNSVEELAFTPANGQNIYQLNKEWIEGANFHKGQINIIPFVPAAGAQFVQSSVTGATGAAYLTFLGGMSWVPAIINVKYTCGFPSGKVPRVMNEIIGIVAAIEVLGNLAATNIATAYSLSIDGVSQMVQGPGPGMYNAKIEALNNKKQVLIQKIRNMYGLQVMSNYI